MAQRTSEKTKLVTRLQNKFRLVVMNVNTFEEKFSLVLSPLNVFTWGGLIVIVLVLLVSMMLAFTPLREYIPGYADVNTRRNATRAIMRSDSLNRVKDLNDRYLSNLFIILNGGVPDSVGTTIEQDPEANYEMVQAGVSKEDSLLREEMEAQIRFSIPEGEEAGSPNDISNFTFFSPLRGPLTAQFNLQEKHFGVDVVAPRNEAVKATLDGTVVIATWTAETGHVIQIQHENNLISVYKHNSVLLKSAGDRVKAGEPIAIVGESGELSTGPHLHFELWFNGRPIDPANYMVF